MLIRTIKKYVSWLWKKLPKAIFGFCISRVDIHVSSGTYIRSIVNDIGEYLHTGAVMIQLTRLSIADYDLKDAIEIKDLDLIKIKKSLILI